MKLSEAVESLDHAIILVDLVWTRSNDITPEDSRNLRNAKQLLREVQRGLYEESKEEF